MFRLVNHQWLCIRPISLSACTSNVQFQSKFDDAVKQALQSGLNEPSLIYDHLQKQNILSDDSFQRGVVKQLDELNNRLKGYHPSSVQPNIAASAGFFFGKLFSKPETKKEKELKPGGVRFGQARKIPGSEDLEFNETINELAASNCPGVYLYGNVGTGKTMLMDLFYSTTPIEKKRRVHFNRFMLSIHEKIHKLRMTESLDSKQVWAKIADDIMRDCHLLCFDEFQVTDIADALNMKQLFSALFERGLIILCTSNRHPDNLYEHGLQRQNFVPFIPMLKSQVSVINLDTGKDYRKSDVFDFNHPSWLIKNDPKIEGHIKNLHLKFGKGEEEVLNSELTVLGHKLKVPRSKGAVAHFSFNDLCLEGLGVPLGAQDYLALTDHFAAIVVHDFPRIDLYVMNSALRRFITLIDQLYDNGCGVLLIFDVHLDELYYDSHDGNRQLTAEERIFMDDHEIKGVSEGTKIATLSGSEEAFAIDRKISRLAEMSSETYWNEVYRIHKTKL